MEDMDHAKLIFTYLRSWLGLHPMACWPRGSMIFEIKWQAPPEKLPIVQPFRKFPSILRNQKVHHRVHKSPPLVPILSQFDPAHTIPSLWSILVFSTHLRLGLVSTAECEYGYGLQTEEHIFWDCKLYEEQWATMMDIHDWEQEKGIPKFSFRALKARGKKICASCVLFHKQNSSIYLKIKVRYEIKEKEANLQNINSIFSGVGYMYILL
jgi:hypothetical protein